MRKNIIIYLALMLLFYNCSHEDVKKDIEVTKHISKVSISDATGQEGSALTFFITLDSASSEVVEVAYKTSDKSANGSEDFTSISVTKLTFQQGETVKEITVTTSTDAKVESDETFSVVLSDIKEGELEKTEGIGIIKNISVVENPITYNVGATVGMDAWVAHTTGSLASEINGNIFASYGTDNNSQILFIVKGKFEEKKYNVNPGLSPAPGNVMAAYTPDFFSGGGNGTSYIGYEGELEIKKIDKTKGIASGSFSFKAKASTNSVIEIASGNFVVPIK